jgi:hypothetical protein
MAVHVGDIGTEIIFDTTEDLSAVTVHNLHYKKPNGTTGVWTTTVDGTRMKFITTMVTDLDFAGTWDVQAYAKAPTWERHSDWDKFTVLPNIQ